MTVELVPTRLCFTCSLWRYLQVIRRIPRQLPHRHIPPHHILPLQTLRVVTMMMTVIAVVRQTTVMAAVAIGEAVLGDLVPLILVVVAVRGKFLIT